MTQQYKRMERQLQDSIDEAQSKVMDEQDQIKKLNDSID